MFSYENINLNNREEIEDHCSLLIEKILGKNKQDFLKEVLFTNNLRVSLSKRMLPHEFNKWLSEKEETHFETAAKTFRTKDEKKRFGIALSKFPLNPIEFLAFFSHELVHIKWNVFFDEHLPENYSQELLEEISVLNHFISEYDACYFEEKIIRRLSNNDKSLITKIDLIQEVDRLTSKYESLKELPFDDFRYKLLFALAELNYLCVVVVGYFDAAEKSESIDKIISNKKITNLFGGTLNDIISFCRECVQSSEWDIVDAAKTITRLGCKQRKLVLKNIQN